MTSPENVRELRLALVLYGGVSLAIYMHGVTKELHRLVQASEIDPPPGPVAKVYAELLHDGVRTRVVVDTIAGSSAGGINAVYLAKALAGNRSQEAIRDLWLEHGAIGQLLRRPTAVPWMVRAVGAVLFAPVWAPLRGNQMSRWLYEALEGMDRGPPPAPDTLMPQDHTLELFVTATDLQGVNRRVVLGEPRDVRDRVHRHTLTFARTAQRDDFTREHNRWLAFAARVTSSFPAAFAPVSLASFAEAIKVRPDLDAVGRRLFRGYTLSGGDPSRAYFIDGGVLDNRPFTQAIEAIKRRAAGHEVDRHLVYVEPDPAPDAAADPSVAHGQLAVAAASIATIPRVDSISGDILAVRRRNDAVARLRAIIAAAFDDVARELDEGALLEQRITEPAYLELKLGDVVDDYAARICAVLDHPGDSDPAWFARDVLRAWARTHLAPELPERRAEFLKAFDAPYGKRRLQFVIDALSGLYGKAGEGGYPSRAQLDAGKTQLYALREELDDTRSFAERRADLEPLFGADAAREHGAAAEDFADEQHAVLTALQGDLSAALEAQFGDFRDRMGRAVDTLIDDRWRPEVRRTIRVRFDGFPYWDARLYPIHALAGVGERDRINLARISPVDGSFKAITKRKLAGAAFASFGAFFTRRGRETDYLRGRLDAADRLVCLLARGVDPEERKRQTLRLFKAIALEEQDELEQAGELLDAVRELAAETTERHGLPASRAA